MNYPYEETELLRRVDASICFHCFRAFGPRERQCCWARNFRPVPGWEAEQTQVGKDGKDIPSYRVARCPQFLMDPKDPLPMIYRRTQSSSAHLYAGQPPIVVPIAGEAERR